MIDLLIVVLPMAISAAGALLVVMTLRRIPVVYTKSLSQHIMQTKQTIAQGMVLLSVACILLWTWSLLIDVAWFTRLTLILTGLSYLVTGLVPYGATNRRDVIHDMAAQGGLATMFVSSALLMYELGGVVALVAGVSMCVQLALLGWFIATKPGQRRFMLLGQITYLAVFLLTIMTVGLTYA